MGLLDRFRRKDELLEWLSAHYSGRAHGRAMSVQPDVPFSATERCLQISLETPGEPEHLQLQRPETYLDAEQTARLPSITDDDWRSRMATEEEQGLRLGGGFVLDPDFNLESRLVQARGRQLVAYLERFSPAVRQLTYEPPYLRVLVAREQTAPQALARDIERAHELLSFLERPLPG